MDRKLRLQMRVNTCLLCELIPQYFQRFRPTTVWKSLFVPALWINLPLAARYQMLPTIILTVYTRPPLFKPNRLTKSAITKSNTHLHLQRISPRFNSQAGFSLISFSEKYQYRELRKTTEALTLSLLLLKSPKSTLQRAFIAQWASRSAYLLMMIASKLLLKAVHLIQY